MWVGGHTDTPVELVVSGNADAKIRNGIPPSVVDDPLFRKSVVITTQMGQTTVCLGKGTTLGKKDTTLPHRYTFTRKIIPVTEKRLDEENTEEQHGRSG